MIIANVIMRMIEVKRKGSDCEFFDFIQSSVGFTSVLLLTPKDTNIEFVVTFNPWLSSHSLAIPVLP